MWAMAARALAGNVAKKGVKKAAVKKAATDVTSTSTSEIAAAAKKITKPKKTATAKSSGSSISSLNPLNWMKEKSQQTKSAGFSEEALDVLGSIDETLKRMLYLQQRAISGDKEEDAKSSKKEGITDKIKDAFKGMGLNTFDALILIAANAKVIFKTLGDAVKSTTDALIKFGDWLLHPEKWFGKNDASKDKPIQNKIIDSTISTAAAPFAAPYVAPSTAQDAMKKAFDYSKQKTLTTGSGFTPVSSGINGPLNDKQLTSIKQTILKGETIGGSYASYRAKGKGGVEQKLLKMTLDQVLKAHSTKQYSMVGGFQYSKDTLATIVSEMKKKKLVNGNELFDAKLQNRIVDYSLQNDNKFKDVRAFAMGDASKKDAAQTAIAREWRGMADVTGKTFGDKDSKWNKAIVSDPEMKKMLNTVFNQRSQPTVQQVSNDKAPVIINNNSSQAKERPMPRMVTPADSPVWVNRLFTQFGVLS